MSPIIILVRPQLGENIGAVARAMSNFGLSELRLVAPRDGWPNRKALEMASGGQHIIESAKVFATFGEAMADIHTAYATTARARDMEKRVVTPDVAMGEIIPPPVGGRPGGGHNSAPSEQITPPPQPSPCGGGRIALVFGPERTGLENEEIALCDTLITIPTAPENSSLNLGQSMVVLGYEWFRQLHTSPERGEVEAQSAEGGGECGDDRLTPSRPSATLPPNGGGNMATKSDWLGLFSQLEEYLDEVNYYRVDHKKGIMWQNLQTMLLRGRWSEQEVRSFRGMIRALWERKRRND